MPINQLNISYPDFVLNTTIDPEQFDTNNREIVNKLNELLIALHSIDGAREIMADAIVGVSGSVNVQTMLTALKTYIDASDTSISTDIINRYNTLVGLLNVNSASITALQTGKADKSNTYLRTELYNKTESDTRLNAHKISPDHDGRYYTKDELATNILKITNPGININIKEYVITATSGQTLFTIPSGVYSRVSDLLEVFYKGYKLSQTTHYKINSDTQIELVGWTAELNAEVILQIQTKVWNTQDLVSGRQLQDGTIDLIKLNIETQGKINNSELYITDLITHSTLVLNQDVNGISTQLQYKRADGTLIMNSVLSGGISPNYTTRTETYYKSDGITVDRENIYSISYNSDGDPSEVLV